MDKAALVDRDIDDGRRLVQALDQADFPVVAALWYFYPEEEWRLLIASPKVGELGPRGAYAVIQQVLIKSGVPLPLYRVAAVNPDEPLITELRIFVGTDAAPHIGSIYLQSEVIGEMYVEGAYVYRAERIIGHSGTKELWSVTRNRSRDVWVARRCRLTFENGFFKKIEVEGGEWPQSSSKNGINARVRILANPEKRGGETFGDVERWTILAGRLRNIETVARGVRIEGFLETPASPAATT
jgi:hypothetical protein